MKDAPKTADEAAEWTRVQRELHGWSTIELARRARDIAQADGSELKLTQQSISYLEQGKQKRLPEWFRYVTLAFERAGIPDAPGPDERAIEYISVPVLPTFAGMGGGGNGDGDVETALVPRRLIESELRGRAKDFLLINVRGDSMEPDFHHGDQLLVDTRDKNPTQPGPFALWFDDSYVIKNVERTREGLRVFSTNLKYREAIVQTEDANVSIIGRPVWFGRKL